MNTDLQHDQTAEMTVGHSELDQTLDLLRRKGRLVLSVAPSRTGYVIRVAIDQQFNGLELPTTTNDSQKL